MNTTREFAYSIAKTNLQRAETLGEDISRLEEGLETPEKDIELFLSLHAGPRMLDIGCCTGRYADKFLSGSLDYVGIDHSPTRIRLARSRNLPARFEVMSYHDLAFADESFDRIWSCCVFHYEPKCNLIAVLQDLRRLLSPNGIMESIIPLSLVSDEGFLPSGTYLSQYKPDEFKAFLETAGFVCEPPIIREASGSVTFLATK